MLGRGIRRRRPASLGSGYHRFLCMDKSWWSIVIQWTLWAVTMSLVMGWIGKTRIKKRSPRDANKLCHPISTLIMGLVGFIFFAALAIISNVIPNKTTTWGTTSIFLIFAAFSLFLIFEFIRARHQLTDSGMLYGRLLLPRQHLLWSDVRSVRYAPRLKWFKIQTATGEIVRVSSMLLGLPEFAQAVLASVSTEAIEPETLPILRATALGELPALWNC